MRASFDQSLAAVLKSEGGYVCDRLDPGGATNRGITQAVYDDWRRNRSLETQDVKLLSPAETCAIYRSLYWNTIHGDDLPSGVDYCCFDVAVNSGPNRSARFLQRAVNMAEDGLIGPQTLSAASAMPPSNIIDRVCDMRITFLRALPTWNHFGAGWAQRVSDVRALAKGMAS